MAKIKVYYDKQGKTITVWFDDPQTDYLSEEAGNEVILMKNREITLRFPVKSFR